MSQMNELYPEREELTSVGQEVFDEFVSQGKAPSTVIASWRYIVNDCTQQEISDKHGVHTQTIRRCYQNILDWLDREAHKDESARCEYKGKIPSKSDYYPGNVWNSQS